MDNIISEIDDRYKLLGRSIILHNLGSLVYLSEPAMFDELYEFVIADPDRIRLVLNGRINEDIESEAIRLNNIAQGDMDLEESRFDSLFPVERQQDDDSDLV